MKQLPTVFLLGSLVAAPAAATTSAVEPDAAAILALNPEIESFIEERVNSELPRNVRLVRLMDALFGKDGLDIQYGGVQTKTAIETFETRSGNCLSFTLLFVALARHLGLTAHFKEVGEILSWDRRGDVAVSNRHMFAEVETAEGVARVDFLPGIEKRYRLVRRIEEHRVLAHYYSNLGAEALTVDKLELAEEMFDRALAADPQLAAAWVNRGVALRRQGRLEEAERCYLRALEIDPNEISAASNLVVLYQAAGDQRAAAPFVRRVEKHHKQNPFFHLRQGLEAARQGELELALKRLKRAIRLQPEDSMFRAELGRVYERAGRPERAERAYLRALAVADDQGERRIVRALLDRLRQSGGEETGERLPAAGESGAEPPARRHSQSLSAGRFWKRQSRGGACAACTAGAAPASRDGGAVRERPGHRGTLGGERSTHPGQRLRGTAPAPGRDARGRRYRAPRRASDDPGSGLLVLPHVAAGLDASLDLHAVVPLLSPAGASFGQVVMLTPEAPSSR